MLQSISSQIKCLNPYSLLSELTSKTQILDVSDNDYCSGILIKKVKNEIYFCHFNYNEGELAYEDENQIINENCKGYTIFKIKTKNIKDYDKISLCEFYDFVFLEHQFSFERIISENPLK